MTRVARGESRGGFALVMVVFLLFAIAVAGVTGYQVVSSEFALATQNRDGQEALAVARAGLQRFLGETVGQVGDSVSYAIGNGVAVVTTRRVLEEDSLNHMYYIRSEGQVEDPRTPQLPARRTVGTYAWHRMSPVPLKGALWVSGGRVNVRSTVNGLDSATVADCPGGGTAGTGGVVYGGLAPSIGSGGSISGNPTTVPLSGFSAVYDTVGIRWDILTSPAFPVDFDGSPPTGIPLDSFPLVRYIGNLDATYTWSGRGVLIVTGRLRFSTLFRWEGIILAGQMGQPAGWASWFPPVVSGMVIAGLNGSNPNFTLNAGTYRYHSCNAYKANRALSYLELVDNTVFEVNG